MRQAFRAAILPLLFWLVALPAMAELRIQKVTSPGGVQAWLVEDHAIPFTALEVRFRGGTSLDPIGRGGAISLMAGLLEEGSGKLDAQGFAEAREALAARYSFDADSDAVSVSAQFLTENRDASVDLLHQALVDPTFDPASVDRVKAQIRAIQKDGDTDPSRIATRTMSAAMLGDHPYARPDYGTAESLAAITRDDLLAIKAASMVRDRLFVAAAGDITPEELGRLLDRLFAGLPATGAPATPDVAPVFNGKVKVVDFDSPQSVVIFTQPGIPFDSPDYYAASILNQIIGGGALSSRLMREVREKRGLTYGVSTGLVILDHTYFWQGGLSSSNDKTAEAIDVVREVWRKARADGVTAEEVQAAKTYMTGSYPLRFDGNATIASILVGMQLIGLPPEHVERRNSLVDAVTLEDVNRVAKTLMDPDKLSFTVVGRPTGLAATP